MARINTTRLIDGGGDYYDTPTTSVTPTATPVPPISSDPYYIRDPKTGLSPAQVEAQKALESAASGMMGEGKLVKPKGSAGQWIAKPEAPPADANFTYSYVWVGGTTGNSIGSYKLIKTPRFGAGAGSSSAGSGSAGSGSAGSGSTGSGDAAAQALLAFNKAQAEAATTAARESAFALLKLEFDKYGLGSLVDTVKNYIMQGSPVEEVTLRLRETPEYQARFAGNQARLKAGLNVYDEATYLQLENAYDQVFTSYGVTEAAGNTVEARRARYAQFIGGTISPDEVKSRVQLAVAAANEDEVTKATLKELYPMISDKDIVSYFLNPKETLPKLETKVRASQIGAAAVRQGLVTNVATAEELVAMGVTEDEAERAYSAYAGMKPTLDKLSGLEKDQELLVNQQVAEGALLKGLASEQRKLEALRQKELARFSGSAGTARGVSLGSAAGGAI